jgi:hypothetical protein
MINAKVEKVSICSDTDVYPALRMLADGMVNKKTSFDVVHEVLLSESLSSDFNVKIVDATVVIDDDGETFVYTYEFFDLEDSENKIATISILYCLERTSDTESKTEE